MHLGMGQGKRHGVICELVVQLGLLRKEGEEKAFLQVVLQATLGLKSTVAQALSDRGRVAGDPSHPHPGTLPSAQNPDQTRPDNQARHWINDNDFYSTGGKSKLGSRSPSV